MLTHLDQILTLALNGSSSLYLDALAMTSTKTLTWIPLALLLLYVIIRNNDLRAVVSIVLGIALCILVADQVASGIFKPLIARYRPTQDPQLMYMVDVVNGYRGGRYGFFSSHAANTMSVAIFLSLLIRRRSLTLWLLSWSLLNCWTRVYLGVHYVGDLTVGILWGVVVGWSVYRLLLRVQPSIAPCPQGSSPDSSLTSAGYSIPSIHLFISGIAITYLYIAFRSLFLP